VTGVSSSIDLDVGEDARLLAGIERVVHGLLDVVSSALRGLSNPSRWRFLAKNSRDGDVPLLGGHRLRVGADSGLRR
jgi:hypothetical protein